MPFSLKAIFFYFFLLPSVIYAGLITQFTFDFLTYDYLWKAYNSLALSILDGRLDVSYEAVGRESSTYEGKVYFYYGYFSVLLRLVLSPFVDLNTVPLARISIWFMTTLGAAFLQYALIFYSKSATSIWDNKDRIKLVLLSLIIWFGGAYSIIIQKGMVFHEPYAAMLMLSSAFVFLFWKELIKDPEQRKYNFILLATIAGFSLHTRQTIAISLYLALLVIIVVTIFNSVKRSADGKIDKHDLFSKSWTIGWKPLTILFLGGCSLLLINYLRFDDIFSLTRGNYGYLRVGEGASERVCSSFIIGDGRFKLERILPNLFYYLTGLSGFHTFLIDYLGLGYVRKGYPGFSLILLWSSVGIAFMTSLYFLLNDKVEVPGDFKPLFLLTLSMFFVGPLILLSYTTISFRYSADLWLPFSFTLLLFARFWLRDNTDREGDKSFINKSWFMKVMTVSIILNLSFGAFMYIRHLEYKIYDTVNGQPTRLILEKLYYPPPKLTKEEKQGLCKVYNFKR